MKMVFTADMYKVIYKSRPIISQGKRSMVWTVLLIYYILQEYNTCNNSCHGNLIFGDTVLISYAKGQFTLVSDQTTTTNISLIYIQNAATKMVSYKPTHIYKCIWSNLLQRLNRNSIQFVDTYIASPRMVSSLYSLSKANLSVSIPAIMLGTGRTSYTV